MGPTKRAATLFEKKNISILVAEKNKKMKVFVWITFYAITVMVGALNMYHKFQTLPK